MGEKIDKLVALAGTIRVESHKRTTKSGKVVDVEAYTRSLSKMSVPELRSNLVDLIDNPTAKGRTAEQARAQLEMTQREIAARKRKGTWYNATKGSNFKNSAEEAAQANSKGPTATGPDGKKVSPKDSSGGVNQNWMKDYLNSPAGKFSEGMKKAKEAGLPENIKYGTKDMTDAEIEALIKEFESKSGLSAKMDAKALKAELERRRKEKGGSAVSLSSPGLHGENVTNLLRLTQPE